MKIYVITDPELGWDCVVGAYTDYREAYESVGGKNPGNYPDVDEEDIHPYMVHEVELIGKHIWI